MNSVIKFQWKIECITNHINNARTAVGVTLYDAFRINTTRSGSVEKVVRTLSHVKKQPSHIAYAPLVMQKYNIE